MSLRIGAQMIRQSDGKRGAVEWVTDHMVLTAPSALKVVYYDRGEKMVAKSGEKWVEFGAVPSHLTEAERHRVAAVADRMLRSLVEHQPFKWWQLDEEAPVFDDGLVKVIVEYLGGR